MSTPPSGPPPEAELIRRRRDTAAPPMSRRRAAGRAGISPSQWSDVERGCKKAGPGILVPVRASAQTLARMAGVVGATPDELSAAGRDDAASELRVSAEQKLLRQRLAAVPGLGVLPESIPYEPDGIQGELLPLIARGLETIDRSLLAVAAKRELTELFTANLLHDTVRRYNELLLVIRLAENAGDQP